MKKANEIHSPSVSSSDHKATKAVIELFEEELRINGDDKVLDHLCALNNAVKESEISISVTVNENIQTAARGKIIEWQRRKKRKLFLWSTLTAAAAAFCIYTVAMNPFAQQSSNTKPVTKTILTTLQSSEPDALDILLQQQMIFSEELKIAIMIDDYLINQQQ